MSNLPPTSLEEELANHILLHSVRNSGGSRYSTDGLISRCVANGLTSECLLDGLFSGCVSDVYVTFSRRSYPERLTPGGITSGCVSDRLNKWVCVSWCNQ